MRIGGTAAHPALLDDVEPVHGSAARRKHDGSAGVIAERQPAGEKAQRIAVHAVERRMTAQNCDRIFGERLRGGLHAR